MSMQEEDERINDNSDFKVNAPNENNGKWTEDEHKKFIKALKIFGKDWKLISKYIGTRTSS